MELHVMIEPHNGASYDDQLAVARAVDAAGLDGLFRADHYLAGMQDPPSDWITDTWTTLAGLARETSRIALGSLVSAATFRSPVHLAIAVAQVDAMSGGRVELGIGTGWWRAEHDAYGIEYPPLAERFDRLAEQLAVITGLWQTAPDSHFTYQGEFYQLRDAPGVRCLRPGGPPIIIGGSGPRRTPELVAHYAREFNSGWQSPDNTSAEYRRVSEACLSVDRDPAGVRRSSVQTLCIGRTDAELKRRAQSARIDLDELRALSTGIVGTPTEAAECINRFREVGTDRLYLEMLDLCDHEQLAIFAEEVLPRL